MYPFIQIVIPSYALMAFVGGFLAVCFCYFRLERYKIDFSQFISILIFSGIGVFVGSKILFALTQLPRLFENFSFINLIMLIPRSGFVFYGGLLGMIGMLLFYTRKDAAYRKEVFRFVTPAMPLFHCFGRIGCFLTGCCYGKELHTHINLNGLYLDRIPVQLIEAFAELVLFVVLWQVGKRKENVDLLRLYLVTYAIIRFSDEFLRGDLVRGIYFGLSTSQWISLGILLFYLIKLLRKKPESV